MASKDINQSYSEAPTRLEMAVDLFTRNGSSEAVGSVHARSVRIPTIENMTIEALALHSGLSVNKVIVKLLEVALDEVFQAMQEDQREQVYAKRAVLLRALLGKDGLVDMTDIEQSKEGDI
jgi:hypothetical protein